MDRKKFLTTVLGASIFISMDGFSAIANAFLEQHNDNNQTPKFASFGVVHLNVTNLKNSSEFWTTVVGMMQRSFDEKTAAFGTEYKTLVVLYEDATVSYQKGYSGLYHFAVHAPDMREFANMLNRLIRNNYPFSPVDHTMSKSLYLEDPDGITIEFTLETPERFKRIITDRGLKVEDTDGTIRSVSSPLNIMDVLKHLKEKNNLKNISNDSYIGHFHLYANDVENSNTFYKKLAFLEFNYLPEFMYADVGAGGPYQHRIAMNSWHGTNKPLAPKNSAGLKHYEIVYHSESKLKEVLNAVDEFEELGDGFWLDDPTGNRLRLSSQMNDSGIK